MSAKPAIAAHAEYASAGGFRAAFGQAYGENVGSAPSRVNAAPLLAAWIETPLRPMMAIADADALYLLEFTDRKNLGRQVRRINAKQARPIQPGRSAVHDQIEAELTDYFAGRLTEFQTPTTLSGTAFQKSVWAGLCDIPYGETRTYLELAGAIGNPKAVRAAASSNANNGLAIIVPCHRVISTGGGLGGYAGGLDRKRWLLEHERKNARVIRA